MSTMRTLVAVFAMVVVTACGGETSKGNIKLPSAPGGTKDQAKWPADDKSMCDWKNKPELEVSESSGPGAQRPNVRRVFKTFGEGDARHKTLVCREIDSNLDGIKDVAFVFPECRTPRGEKLLSGSVAVALGGYTFSAATASHRSLCWTPARTSN